MNTLAKGQQANKIIRIKEGNVPLDFEKMGGLVPAIVQDSDTLEVLMLGFMNNEAFEKTINSQKVTFWSRSRCRLWTKGERSGNFLLVDNVYMDCDSDAVLIKAKPMGPTCHTGNRSCFYKQYGCSSFSGKPQKIIDI